VFLHLRWIGLCERKWAFLHPETVISRKYSFQKLTEFSQGNNVVNVAASTMHGFIWKDRCVSSTQLNSSIWNKRTYVYSEFRKLQEVFLWKASSLLTGKNVLDAPASNTDGFFFFERYMCFFNLGENVYMKKMTL
jgi:hypothetical protein